MIFCKIMILVILTISYGTVAGDKLVKIDGSSTVFPVTEAVAEEFQKENKKVRVTVGISGTGGGFKKFCNKEIDISDASRPIKPTELELCKKNGVDFIELPIAYDGLAVVVNKKNTWCANISVRELKKMWEPEAKGKITKWNDIRKEWPEKAIKLYGAGTDSGTFDYFTEVVCGKEKASRSDYTASEDDNVLVQGILRDQYAIGYFGLAYYEHNKESIKLVAIDDENDDNGKGAILPSMESINNGSYKPLARPIFIYVSKSSAERSEVSDFIKFYLTSSNKLVSEVGYIPLPDTLYALFQTRFFSKKIGTVYIDDLAKKKTLEDLYKEKKDKKKEEKVN